MHAHATTSLSYFVPIGFQALFAHINTFIAALFKRATDDGPSVRRHICQALVLLLLSRPEKLMPEMNNVAEYILYARRATTTRTLHSRRASSGSRSSRTPASRRTSTRCSPRSRRRRACNHAAWAVGKVALCYVYGKLYNEMRWITDLVNSTHMPNVFTCI